MEIDLLKYTALIQKIMTKFPKHYHQDLLQEGYIAIIEASRNFDPDRGNFETYIKKWIYFAMLKFVSPDSLTNSLDQPIIDSDGETTTYLDLLEDTNDYDKLYEDVDYYEKHMGNLTQVERFVTRKYYVDNLSVEEIIKLYSHWTQIRNPKTVYKILKLKKK